MFNTNLVQDPATLSAFFKQKNDAVGKHARGVLNAKEAYILNENSSMPYEGPDRRQVKSNYEKRLEAIKETQDKDKERELWTGIATNLQKMVEGKKYPNGNSAAANTGLTLQDPGLLQREVALPFDKGADTERNLNAVINAIGQQRYAVTEKVRNMMTSSIPEVKKILTDSHTVYQTVPPGFLANRLYIAQARQRQNSVYGF